MTFKTLIQTRWQTEPDRIIIYPYGIVYLISIAMGIIWGGMLIFIGNVLKDEVSRKDILAIYPLYLIYFGIVVLLWMFARTAIVFDNQRQTVYKKLFGLITTRVIHFNDVSAILAVRNSKGTMQYRIFSKKRRSGLGTIISSAFLNEESEHAKVFKQQVLSVIYGYLKNYNKDHEREF